MKIAVGFITYNLDTAKYLPYFLDSLFKALETWPKDEILILACDNSDEADNYNRDYIETVFNKESRLINFSWSGENLGFAKSYNKMILEANNFGAEFFLMINPDTVLSPDSLLKLTTALNADKNLGSVAPKLLRWDFANLKLTKQIDSCGLTLSPGLQFSDIGQGKIDDGSFDSLDILGPSGAAALYRLNALNQVKESTGYLDERIFMYKEDCDLAYRLSLAGFSSQLVPQSLIYHDRTATSSGKGILNSLRSRGLKSKQVRAWSFLYQHLLFIKFWSKQGARDKIIIIARVFFLAIFALFREPFLLKNYFKIVKFIK